MKRLPRSLFIAQVAITAFAVINRDWDLALIAAIGAVAMGVLLKEDIT